MDNDLPHQNLCEHSRKYFSIHAKCLCLPFPQSDKYTHFSGSPFPSIPQSPSSGSAMPHKTSSCNTLGGTLAQKHVAPSDLSFLFEPHKFFAQVPFRVLCSLSMPCCHLLRAEASHLDQECILCFFLSGPSEIAPPLPPLSQGAVGIKAHKSLLFFFLRSFYQSTWVKSRSFYQSRGVKESKTNLPTYFEFFSLQYSTFLCVKWPLHLVTIIKSNLTHNISIS